MKILVSYLPIRFIFIFLLNLISFQDGKVCAQSDFLFNHLNVSHGLSNNQINAIYKDNEGFMWFGTMAGLNRYDGYSFKIYKYDIDDSSSISDNFVNQIMEDHLGRLWIGTRNGFNIFDPVKEKFISPQMDKAFERYISLAPQSVNNIIKASDGNFWYLDNHSRIFRYNNHSDNIEEINFYDSANYSASEMYCTDIASDHKGNIWVVTTNGILKLISKEDKKVKKELKNIYDLMGGKLNYYLLFVDNDDGLWINAKNDALGIFYFDFKSGKFHHITKDKGPARLNTNIVNGIIQDDNGKIWIATDHGGLNCLDKETFSIMYLLHNPNDQRSISQNSITSIYKDNTGIIWLGTFKKGVCYYHEEIIKFKSYKHIPSISNSLIIDDVNCFAEDMKGNVWIGTNGGGLDYFDRDEGRFNHYAHNPIDIYSLSNNIIVNLYMDKNNILWIGTYYGGLNYYDGNRFYRFVSDENDPNSIADNRIWKIFEDSQGRLWIGTLGGGVDLFDRKNKVFKHFKETYKVRNMSDYISDIDEDKDGNIWIGTANGIVILTKEDQIRILQQQTEDSSTLSNNNITALECDDRGYVWIGTREGLNLFNIKEKKYKIFRQSDGLADNVIATVIMDDFNNIWIGTPNGLSNLILENDNWQELSISIKNYEESDGLQGKEFNQNAALKNTSGDLLFGGANGFNIIQPEKIKSNKREPDIVFTSFEIYNKEVKVGEEINGRVLFEKSVMKSDEVVLKYQEKMFSIGFTALNYFQPEKNKYKYRLIGFNDEWLDCDVKLRKITYTNLDPGEYTFQVIASNNDGLWNLEGTSLQIVILPPYWKTKWAFFVYIILIAGILFMLRYMVVRRERMKNQVLQDKLKAQRRHELDLLKIKFFTNISHEFKTPLTLIITPLEKIITQTTEPKSIDQFQLIYRNARRLLNLVNKLLDFRRMEIQEVKLNPSPGELISFVKEILDSFVDLSEKKGIDIGFETELDHLKMEYDHDKLEKIIFNLLSNAFKFTPEEGKITVRVALRKRNSAPGTDQMENSEWVDIQVEDTGIGIPKEKQEKIFVRFFQDDIPGTMLNQGSGIGLSLVSEFVRLHRGYIKVESEPGSGSIFTVSLPLLRERKEGQKNIIAPSDDHIIEEYMDDQLPKVLIVEDNEDFRFYLKDNLRSNYNILEAPNGKSGLEMAQEFMPDLIVSDVMMPEMDGIEFCQKIKSDPKTSQIPFILLTAVTSDEQQVQGFEFGADGYITKPFSFEILESRIRNLVKKHNIIQKKLQKKIDIKLSEIEITSKDEKLINKALSLVEEHMSNPDFSVEELSREIGMSRVHLYKKLLAITGKTPIEFIRTIRLKRAAQLLEKSQMSVSEVAYKVGFNNPKYFTKYFKTEFNMLPSVFMAEKMKQQDQKHDFDF